MDRRQFLETSILSAGLFFALEKDALALPTKADLLNPDLWKDVPPFIKAPEFSGDRFRWQKELDYWRADLENWRKEVKKVIGYNDQIYRKESPTSWTSTAYLTHFIMMFDQTLVDSGTGEYRIDAYLDAKEADYGKFDVLVLWQGYPLLGFDDRNQYDFYRNQPGGLSGLSRLVSRCHERGYKVFLSYLPWDQDTRKEEGDFIQSLLGITRAIGSDGIFFDTVHGFEKAELNRMYENFHGFRKDIAFEAEEATPLDKISSVPMGWAYNNNYNGWTQPVFPVKPNLGVLRNRWFERRYLVKMCARSFEQTHILHIAWMNGTGVMVYENLFGAGFKWKPKDCSILRQMIPVFRRFSSVFQTDLWFPLVDAPLMDNVYSSRWESCNQVIWTVINGNNRVLSGNLLSVDHKKGARYFDIIRGLEIKHEIEGNKAVLPGSVVEYGIGGVLSCTDDKMLDKGFFTFLENQARIYNPSDWSEVSPKFIQKLKPVPVVPPVQKDSIPTGMVPVSAAEFEMEVQYTHRECLFYQDSSISSYGGQAEISKEELAAGRAPFDPDIVTFKVMNTPVRLLRRVTIPSFAMDITPVTNGQFQDFLSATQYQPFQKENFLKHWKGGVMPRELRDHPVVYVDVDDARAYAAWAGKRLPTEEEWQYAAQGPDFKPYPWGFEMEPNRCNPGGNGTTSVRDYPMGISDFGCLDMCGNTWEMTESERTDGRTRFLILKGGSYFKAPSSVWYADGGPKVNQWAAKYILYYPGLSRSPAISFRCALGILK